MYNKGLDALNIVLCIGYDLTFGGSGGIHPCGIHEAFIRTILRWTYLCIYWIDYTWILILMAIHHVMCAMLCWYCLLFNYIVPRISEITP